MQSCIEPPLIMFSKKEDMEECQTNTIKVKMQHNPVSATSETYELQMKILENGQIEELIVLLKNFRKSISGRGTTNLSGRNKYLRTMLRGESLREIDKLASQNNGSDSRHLKAMKYGWKIYPPPPPMRCKNRSARCMTPCGNPVRCPLIDMWKDPPN